MADAPGHFLKQSETSGEPFEWTEAASRAVELLAEDRLTDAQIATKVGMSRTTLWRWKQHPEFKAKVTELFDEMIERARRRGIARLDRRMDAAADRHLRMTRLIAERAKDMKGEIAGGSTGLLVRTPKRVQVTITTVVIDDENGKETEEVETHTEERFEYAFDAALMRELREIEKQVAQDTGQWSEKRELSGPNGGPIPITSIEVVLDKVAS